MKDDDLANDLLDGIPAIAAFLGLSVRMTYDLAGEGFRCSSLGVKSGRVANQPCFAASRIWKPKVKMARRRDEYRPIAQQGTAGD
jgi:hypothetical protein